LQYLSEIVFSKSTKAPPHIKRISVVSICIIMRFCYRHVILKTVKNEDGFMMSMIPIQIVTKCRIFMPYTLLAQPLGCCYLVVRKCTWSINTSLVKYVYSILLTENNHLKNCFHSTESKFDHMIYSKCIHQGLCRVLEYETCMLSLREFLRDPFSGILTTCSRNTRKYSTYTGSLLKSLDRQFKVSQW